MRRVCLLWLVALWSVLAWGDQRPVIKHDPATVVIRGQALGLTASVQDDAGAVKAVNLFYTASRNTTPFKIKMNPSGSSVYYGTIPGHLIGPATDEIYYYIEATDTQDQVAETDWFAVKVREASAGAAPVATPRIQPSTTTAGPAPASSEPAGEKSNLLPVVLIAGGAAAVVGGAVLLANKSSGSDNGGDDPEDKKSGTYAGTRNLCFEPEGGMAECNDTSIKITIDDLGAVQGQGFWGDQVFNGTLVGASSFTLVGDVGALGTWPAGRLILAGSVANGKIEGRIDGYSTDPVRPATYSGYFSASR